MFGSLRHVLSLTAEDQLRLSKRVSNVLSLSTVNKQCARDWASSLPTQTTDNQQSVIFLTVNQPWVETLECDFPFHTAENQQ